MLSYPTASLVVPRVGKTMLPEAWAGSIARYVSVLGVISGRRTWRLAAYFNVTHRPLGRTGEGQQGFVKFHFHLLPTVWPLLGGMTNKVSDSRSQRVETSTTRAARNLMEMDHAQALIMESCQAAAAPRALGYVLPEKLISRQGARW